MNARILIRSVFLAAVVIMLAVLAGFVLAVVTGLVIAHPTTTLIGLGVILSAALVYSITVEASDTSRYGDPYG